MRGKSSNADAPLIETTSTHLGKTVGIREIQVFR
jgi:hypothetical protein